MANHIRKKLKRLLSRLSSNNLENLLSTPLPTSRRCARQQLRTSDLEFMIFLPPRSVMERKYSKISMRVLSPCCVQCHSLINFFTGDQAEITFTLIGEPPFTFTYQRSELAPKKGGIGKVLETHTVSRVYTNEYSIFSALEGKSNRAYDFCRVLKILSTGTWTVTSISDRYCRYPPAQPDLAGEKRT